jgi:hypothetical protein
MIAAIRAGSWGIEDVVKGRQRGTSLILAVPSFLLE